MYFEYKSYHSKINISLKGPSVRVASFAQTHLKLHTSYPHPQYSASDVMTEKKPPWLGVRTIRITISIFFYAS